MGTNRQLEYIRTCMSNLYNREAVVTSHILVVLGVTFIADQKFRYSEFC